MKICWDNLEKIRLNKNGDFVTYYTKMIYKDSCKRCGEPYLMDKRNPTNFCSHSCSASGSNNPMYGKLGKESPLYGSKRSKESIEKMSNAAKNRKPMSEYTRLKISKKSMGRRHSDFSIEKIRASKIGKKRSKEVIEKMRASAYKGKDSRFWKGGIRKNKISLYDTYAHRIDFAEEVSYKLNEGGLKILLVKCSYCGKWFNPSTVIVQHRISSLEGRSQGEKRLYCSESCKKACPIYNQTLYPKGFKPATSREVQPELRQLVLERDDWTCQYGNCGKTTDNAELHCHHITGIKQNPIESADVDNCITLCKKHHKKVHSQAGCKYFDLRCS